MSHQLVTACGKPTNLELKGDGMPLLSVHFTLKYLTKDSFSRRYSTFIDKITELMDPRWHHLTSTVIGESPHDAKTLAYLLFHNTDIFLDDHVLVIDLDNRNFAYFGEEPIDLEALRRMFTEIV